MTMPTPPAPPPTPPPPDPTPPAPPPEAKTFTQAQLDAIVKDRLAREQAKFAGFDEIAAKAAKFDEQEAANKSDLDKANARAEAAEKAAVAAKATVQDALKRVAVTTAAMKANAVDPDAVFALLDQSKVTVADDGTVTGVDDAVKSLLESKPYLVGNQTPPPGGGADGGPRGAPVAGQLTQADLDRLRKEGKHDEISKAHQEGRLNQLMGA